jgi:hypothetical protein
MTLENRTTTYEVTFNHSFEIKGVGERLSAGTYVIEDEEAPLMLSSAIGYRRIATTIRVPTAMGVSNHSIAHADLEKALQRDAAAKG